MAELLPVRCDAPAQPNILGGPRCGAPAAFATLTGYYCATCIELFRKAARDPNTLMNIIAGRACTDEEIERMIRVLP